MEAQARPPKIVRFGPFEADSTEEILLKNGLPVRLQEQPLKLLLLLLARPGEIVSREEMRSRLWPANSYGDFDNGVNVAVAKLRVALGDDSDRPQFIETVPRRGYRFIAQVIEVDRQPAQSSALVTPSPQPVEPTLVPAPVGAAILPARREINLKRWGWLLGFAFLLAAAWVAATLWRARSGAPSSPSGAASAASRRSVAVLVFHNSARRPSDAWLSTALSEMLSTELAAGDHLRLISGEDVAHLSGSLSGIDVDSISRGTARQLRHTLNTDYIVCGSYAVLEGGESRLVRLDVRLQDAGSGEILAEVSDSGTERALFHLVGDIGERLRQKLGVSAVSGEEHNEVLASMPANREAGEFYSRGLARLRSYDAPMARELLEQAVAADPGFPLAHEALSEVWTRLGYDQRAVKEAEKARDLSAALLPTERLRVQGRFLEATRDWSHAADAYRKLQTTFPDEPEYRVLLARCLVRAGKGTEALSILDGEPKTAGTDNGREPIELDAGIELGVAEAASSLGDFNRALAAARSAAASAQAHGQSLSLAKAYRTQGLVLVRLAQYDKALAATENARQLYEQAGDHYGVASALEVQGNALFYRGDLAGAAGRYSTELTFVRQVGNKRAEASALNNLAMVLNQQGDLEQSGQMWQQAEAAFREIDDKSNTPIVLVNLGGVYKDQGNLKLANQKYQEALALARETNSASSTELALNSIATVLDAQGDYGRAKSTLSEAVNSSVVGGPASFDGDNRLDLADVLRHQGDLNGARAAYQQVLNESRKSGEKSWIAYAYYGLGKLAVLSADFAEAHRCYDQALQIRKELGEMFTVAESQTAIAELAIEEGHPIAAESALREAREILRKAKKQDDFLAGTALLTRLLLARGQASQAWQEIDALPRIQTMQGVEMRLETAIARGRIQAALHKLPEARESLQSALREARLYSCIEYVFEARLALIECDAAGARRSAKAAELARDAQRAGYKLVAMKATTA
jgi:DNA-binding winged helix-turn-helix (wHTH) protein/tetratricopeptide (TPR) repeat protein